MLAVVRDDAPTKSPSVRTLGILRQMVYTCFTAVETAAGRGDTARSRRFAALPLARTVQAALGLLLAAAGWVLWPQAVGAQCAGGTSMAGYYLRNGNYVPGGCAYTNSIPPEQMYPGQPFRGAGAPPQTLGPGAPNDWTPGGYLSTGLGATGLANTGNGLGTISGLNGITGTQGLPLTTGTSVLSGDGMTNLVLPGGRAGGGTLMWDTAYGTSLQAAPPVSSQAASPAPANLSPPAPPVPGRGGAIYIGEEGGDGTIISLPNQ